MITDAARFPFEPWIIPKNHNACFDEAQSWEYNSLSRIIKKVLLRLDKVLNIPPAITKGLRINWAA